MVSGSVRSRAPKTSPGVGYERVGSVDKLYADYQRGADRQFAIMAVVVVAVGFGALYYSVNLHNSTHAESLARAAHHEHRLSQPDMNEVGAGQQNLNVLAQHMLDEGHDQIETGDWLGAVKTLMSALEMRPTHQYAIHCHFALAHALAQLGEPFVPTDEGNADAFVGQFAATDDEVGELGLTRVRTGVKMAAKVPIVGQTLKGPPPPRMVPVEEGKLYTMAKFNGTHAFLSGGLVMKNLLPQFQLGLGIDYAAKYNSSFHSIIALALGVQYGVPLQVVNQDNQYWATAVQTAAK